MISVPKRERYSVVMVVHPTIGVVSYNRVNKTTFIEFLNNLVPQLPRQTKAVLMDNVAFHRSRDVVQFLELHGSRCSRHSKIPKPRWIMESVLQML